MIFYLVLGSIPDFVRNHFGYTTNHFQIHNIAYNKLDLLTFFHLFQRHDGLLEEDSEGRGVQGLLQGLFFFLFNVYLCSKEASFYVQYLDTVLQGRNIYKDTKP